MPLSTADHGVESFREALGPEGVPQGRLHVVPSKQVGNHARVDQDVLMTLVVTSPRSVLVLHEDRHLTNEPIGRGNGTLGDDRPVIRNPRGGGGRTPRLPVGQVAEIDREQSAGTEGMGDRRESPLDRRGIRQVVQDVTDRDDRIGIREGTSGNVIRRISPTAPA